MAISKPSKLRLLFTLVLLQTLSTAICQIDDYRLWITREGGGNGYGQISSVNLDGSGHNAGLKFEGAREGKYPSDLLHASDGFVYGTTNQGGRYDRGALFRIEPDQKSYKVLYNFTPEIAPNPVGGLIEATNGKLYGGSDAFVYSFNKTNGLVEIIYQFPADNTDNIYVMQASNGYLYGTAGRGLEGGSIFRIDLSNNTGEILAEFTALYPGRLTEASNGILYLTIGQISQSSDEGSGIYKINLDGSGFEMIADFAAIGTSKPSHRIIEGGDGYLYGTSKPDVFAGVVYKIKKDGSDLQAIHSFDFAEGSGTSLGVTEANDGRLYGFSNKFSTGYFLFRMNLDGSIFEILEEIAANRPTCVPKEISPGAFLFTSTGGPSNNGGIYEISSIGNYNTVKEFPESVNSPWFSVQPTNNGEMYGFGARGNRSGAGGLFKVSRDGLNTVTSTFENPDLTHGVVYFISAADSEGNLYNQTSSPSGIIKISPDNTITRIHEFSGPPNESQAIAQLFYASNGFIYGINEGNRADVKSYLYRVKPDGSEYSVEYTFDEVLIRRQPIAFEHEGYLYGICAGGADNVGSIYRINMKTRFFERIFDLTTDFGLATFRLTRIIKGSDNMIYGMGAAGGASKQGLLFKMPLTGGSYQELHSFSANVALNGWTPTAIVDGPDEKIYGVCAYGGTNGNGTIFSINKDGSGYDNIFDLPKDSSFMFVAELDLVLAPKLGHHVSFELADEFRCGQQPITLSATSDKGFEISYSSSNPSVAVVEGSSLKFVAVGEATIIAEQLGNDFYTKASISQTITVTKGNQTIPVEVITPPIVQLDPTQNTIELPGAATSGLVVTYTAASDNIEIVGNKVTVLAAGRALVLAEQEGDVNYEAAEPVEISFCVNPPKPIISDERDSHNSIILMSSNDVGNQWYMNDQLIATATSQSLSISVDGTYTVQTTIEGCSSDVSDEYLSSVTAIETTENEFSIYPNAFSGKLVVEINESFPNEVSIKILDNTGKLCLSHRTSDEIVLLDTTSLNSGVYIIHIEIKDKIYKSKLVKY